MKKRTIAMILAVLFVLALFSGCGGKGTTTENTAAPSAKPTEAAKTAAPSNSTTESAAPVEEVEVDRMAKGKYQADADGWPTAKYEYELPLTDREVELSFFTLTWTAQFMPEGLMENVDYWIEMQRMTGIHLNFIQSTSANCKEQFAVLLASDEVPDITSQGQYRYSGTTEQSIDEKVFANLYDYREYMPNYMYEIAQRSVNNKNCHDTVFIKPNKIVSFYGLAVKPSLSGWSLRQDLMDELGLGLAENVNTIDKLHTVLAAFKSADYGGPNFWPTTLYSTLEREAGKLFTGLNTYLTINLSIGLRIVDGTVQVIGIQDDEKEGISILRQWYSEGLISPNYTGYTSNTDMENELTNGLIGFLSLATGDASNYNNICTDPDCNWQAASRILREEDQTVHFGLSTSGVGYGTFSVGANCEEIPLAVSWCDWQYSESGSEYITWGVEGVLWERNEKGERYATDMALNFERGWGWAIMTFANCALMEGGLNGTGDKCINVDSSYNDKSVSVWANVKNDDAWAWRTGATLTPEEKDEVSSLTTDVQTYQTEHWSMMVESSESMEEWDTYVANMKKMGFDRMQEIYQEAYDRFIATQV